LAATATESQPINEIGHRSDRLEPREVMEALPEFEVKTAVIIPVGDATEFLRSTLESVLSQNYRPNKIVVVFDGTPNKSDLELQLTQLSPNVVFLNNERSKGIAGARNTGIFWCKDFDVIFTLDADDVCVSERFQAQLDFFQDNPSVSVVAGVAGIINSQGDQLGSLKSKSVNSVHVNLQLSKKNIINHSSTAIRVKSLIDLGGYDEDLARAIDYDLWLRFALNGSRISIMNKHIVDYRLHTNQISRNTSAFQYRIFKKISHQKFGLGRSEGRSLVACFSNLFLDGIVFVANKYKFRKLTFDKHNQRDKNFE